MHKCSKCYTIGTIAGLAIIVIACFMGFYRTTVIDAHEHIESLERAEVLLMANEANNVSQTVLVPTPTETLTLNGHKSFTDYRKNTSELFKILEKYPNKFIVFCTINPLEPDALVYLKQCIERGGSGIKLYNGHSYYYDIFGIPLDSPRMNPIYAYAERNNLPILYHINITKFGEELENVLEGYPDLVMSVPHYMVSSIRLDRVRALLDKYPNLYTDISFGSPEYMASGFRRISNNTQKYGNFINDYSDRVLFGADMVLTSAQTKDLDFMDKSLSCYKALLEERNYECSLVSDHYKQSFENTETRYEQCEPKEGNYCNNLRQELETLHTRYKEVIRLNGLGLSPAVLERIYRKNPQRFLSTSN